MLIITPIGNGLGGRLVSKKMSGLCFWNCLKKRWYIWFLHMGVVEALVCNFSA